MAVVSTFTKDEAVFVSIGKSMLCIGSREDVDSATPEEIVEMIYEALQIAAYMAVNSKNCAHVH